MRQATQMEPTLLKLFATLSILLPTAAFAENTTPFPDYPDPSRACRQAAVDSNKALSNGGGGGDRELTEAAANDCIADAQRDYDFAKAIWPQLTQQTATTCVNHANRFPGSAWQWKALASCASSLYSLQPLPPQVFTK
jgi:hypothetical protein